MRKAVCARLNRLPRRPRGRRRGRDGRASSGPLPCRRRSRLPCHDSSCLMSSDAAPPRTRCTAPCAGAVRDRALGGVVWRLGACLLLAWLITALVHSAPHRAMACPDRARASAALGVPREDRRDRGAHRAAGCPAVELRDVALLDARGRPRCCCRASSPRWRARAARLIALELRFEQLLIDGARARRAARRRRPHARRRPRLRRPAATSATTAPRSTGSSPARVRDPRRHAALDRRAAPARRPLALDRRPARACATACATTSCASTRRRPRAGASASRCGAASPSRCSRGAGDWRRWSGTAYADLPRADVRELRRHVDLPFELERGRRRAARLVRRARRRAAARHRRPRAARGRAAPRRPTSSRWRFEQIEGRFVGAERDDDGGAARAAPLRLRDRRRRALAAGRPERWPGASGDGEAAVAGGSSAPQRLDVGVMAQIAAARADRRRRARAAGRRAPRGVVSGLRAQWEGPLDAPRRYRVKRRSAACRWRARPPRAARRRPARPAQRDAAARRQRGRRRGARRVEGRRDRAARRVRRSAGAARPAAARSCAGRSSRAPAPRPRAERDGAAQGRALRQRRLQRGELRARTWRPAADAPTPAAAARFPGPARARRQARRRPRRAHRRATCRSACPKAPRSYVERAVRGGTIRSADLPRQGRPARFPVLHAANAGAPPSGEFRIAGEARGRRLRLRAGGARRRGVALAGAHRRRRRAGLRPRARCAARRARQRSAAWR